MVAVLFGGNSSLGDTNRAIFGCVANKDGLNSRRRKVMCLLIDIYRLCYKFHFTKKLPDVLIMRLLGILNVFTVMALLETDRPI